jgi:hypothetical protein
MGSLAILGIEKVAREATMMKEGEEKGVRKGGGVGCGWWVFEDKSRNLSSE